MHQVDRLLTTLRQKGIKLWVDRDQLHYKTPKGSLLPDEIENLRSLKIEIISELRRESALTSLEQQLVRRECFELAALSYTQEEMLRWIGTCPAETKISLLTPIAVRFLGAIDPQTIQRSLEMVVHRHDSLRTRIAFVHDGPMQCIWEKQPYHLEIVDLSQQKRVDIELELKDKAQQFVDQNIDISDALFSSILLKISNEDYILMFSVSHLVSDGFSFGILVREIIMIYDLLSKDSEAPPVTNSLQFADYAQWQRSTCDQWLSLHHPYWDRHLAGASRLCIPTKNQSSASTDNEYDGDTTVDFGEKISCWLRQFSSKENRPLSNIVLAIYAAAMSYWCSSKDFVLPILYVGRNYPCHFNMIGYLAHSLHLRIKIVESNNLLQLLKDICNEIDQGVRHADFGRIGVISPEFLNAALFNWHINAFSGAQLKQQSEFMYQNDGFRVERFALPKKTPPEKRVIFLPHSHIMTFSGQTETIKGTAYFNPSRFARGVGAEFARVFVCFAELFCENTTSSLSSIFSAARQGPDLSGDFRTN